MHKKGMELSLTVLILIILSIIIFIGGMSLLWKFFQGAESIKGGIDMQTKNQIESLLREGNELVAIPVNTQTAAVGKELAYGLGIRNIQETQGFTVKLNFAGVFDQQGKRLEIGYNTEAVENAWLGNYQLQGPIMIARNAYEFVPLHVRVAPSVDGTQMPHNTLAVFYVCVFAGNVPENANDCDPKNPDTVAAVYDKIHQIFVNVQ